MAEHRVMSEDLLGITHYRSKRYNESQQFGRSLSGVFPLGGDHLNPAIDRLPHLSRTAADVNQPVRDQLSEHFPAGSRRRSRRDRQASRPRQVDRAPGVHHHVRRGPAEDP